jgi:hypothetical protein
MSHDVLGQRAFTLEQKQILANQIDEDMQAIGDHLPIHVKRGAPGLTHRLCELPGIGKLEGLYLGNFAVRAQVISEQAAWYADFDLAYYRGVPYGQPTMRQEHMTTPEMLDSDADDPLAVAQLVEVIRDFYTRPQTNH